MNRHERRRRYAMKKYHNEFYKNYVRHLPRVPLDAPLERGRVYHSVIAHDDWCRIYSGENCNCNPVLTRHVEPKRS